MKTFSDLIDAFGGTAEFGSALRIPHSHARTMKARNSVPVEHWRRLVTLANERQIKGVSFTVLSELRENRFSKSDEAAA